MLATVLRTATRIPARSAALAAFSTSATTHAAVGGAGGGSAGAGQGPPRPKGRVYGAARTGLNLRPNFFAADKEPVDIAYFTGNPNYFKLIAQVNELMRVHRLYGLEPDSHVTYPAWFRPHELKLYGGVHMNKEQATDLYLKLNLLFCYAVRTPAVYDFLRRLTRTDFANLFDTDKTPAGAVGPDGVVTTSASRKTARVIASLVPGEGLIYVNGKPIHEYFHNIHYRKAALRPLEVIGAFTKYNIWAKAVDGGQKSQAEALSVAIARAITAFGDPLIKTSAIKRYTIADPRQTERKKTGQPGARKKNQWLRR